MATVTAWDAQAEYALGVFIQRWLADNPAPPGAAFAEEFADWAERLIAAGRRSLDGLPPRAQTSPARACADTYRERKAAWRRMPQDQREALLLKALGEERLTLRELAERINRGDGPLRESTIRHTVAGMVEAGKVDRQAEPWHGRVRYRYSRRRALDGPIAGQERAYNEEARD